MEKEITKEELYLEVQRLSREVKFLYDKLDKNEKYRTHFLSNMRNSIVNPFSSIMGLAEHIIKVQKHDWKKVIRISSLIHTEAYNLDFQLKNIFCAAEVEAGIKMPLAIGINLPDIINKEINALRFLFRRKGLNWKVDHEGMEGVFHTDPAFFRVILSNLLHNAYKYSKKDGEIHINVLKTEDRLGFIIKDFGIGIPKDHRETIFNSFERVDEEINSIDSGQGLGLSVTKMLVELLNGEITVESEIDTFTEFRLVIPEMEPAMEEGGSGDDEDLDFFIEEGSIF